MKKEMLKKVLRKTTIKDIRTTNRVVKSMTKEIGRLINLDENDMFYKKNLQEIEDIIIDLAYIEKNKLVFIPDNETIEMFEMKLNKLLEKISK